MPGPSCSLLRLPTCARHVMSLAALLTFGADSNQISFRNVATSTSSRTGSTMTPICMRPRPNTIAPLTRGWASSAPSIGAGTIVSPLESLKRSSRRPTLRRKASLMVASRGREHVRSPKLLLLRMPFPQVLRRVAPHIGQVLDGHTLSVRSEQLHLEEPVSVGNPA
jgi:hypothetical protein